MRLHTYIFISEKQDGGDTDCILSGKAEFLKAEIPWIFTIPNHLHFPYSPVRIILISNKIKHGESKAGSETRYTQSAKGREREDKNCKKVELKE